MSCGLVVLLTPILCWIGGLEGKRLQYMTDLSESIEREKSHQDPFYTAPEIAMLYRYYVLSYTMAIGDGVLDKKYLAEFEKINKTLLAVDWGKLKPTECEKRMEKLEADLKASGIRIDALKEKSVKQGLSRQEDLELDALHKSRKAMSEELTKYKDHISLNE